MARSRRRTVSGHTTETFKPVKIKVKKSLWPGFIVAILIIIAGYFVWDLYIKPMDILSPGKVESKEKTPEKKNSQESEDKIDGQGQSVNIDSVKQNAVQIKPVENQPRQKSETTAKSVNTQQTKKKETKKFDIPPPIQSNIQVEVLNGCGVAGIASKFAKFLRKQGVDVVKTGNYKSMKVRKTQIIDRIGNKEFSNEVGEILSVNEKYIYTQLNKKLLVDATIIIGKDYNKLNQ